MILLLAYVDPGSAGFIVTTVLGVLAAGGYIARASLGLSSGFSAGILGEVASGADDQADDEAQIS